MNKIILKTDNQTKYMRLYQPVSRKISSYCRMLTKNKAQAEDLLHDTILASFENLDSIKSEKAFPSFLYSTAYNIYCKQIRREKFKGNYNEQAASFIQDFNADPLTKTELSVILEKMKLLPRRQYDVMMLYHVADLPMVEIMKLQDISLATVKQRLKKGRENLLKQLNEKQQRIALLML